MTVPSEVNRSGPYLGNGVTTIFSYGFKIVNQAHLRVIRTDAAGNETVLTLGTNYSVAGVGNAGGGSVTVSPAPASGQKITILRAMPFTQNLDLENQGAYYAEDVERAFDEAAMRDQQLAEELKRAVKVPPGANDPDGQLSDELAKGILTLYPISDSIKTVADNVGIVETVSDSIAVVQAVGTNIAAVLNVHNKMPDVQNVSDKMDDVSNVSDNMAVVRGVSENMAAVQNVNDNMAVVQTVGTNISAVQNIDANMAAVQNIDDHMDDLLAADGSLLKLADASYVATAGQTEFVMPADANSASNVLVWVDGIRQVPNVDYTTLGPVLTLADPLALGQAVDVLVNTAVTIGEAQKVGELIGYEVALNAEIAQTYGARTKDSLEDLIADVAMTPENTAVGATVNVRGAGDYVRVASGGDVLTVGALRFAVVEPNALVNQNMILRSGQSASDRIIAQLAIAEREGADVLVGRSTGLSNSLDKIIYVSAKRSLEGKDVDAIFYAIADFAYSSCFRLNVDASGNFITESPNLPRTKFKGMRLNARLARNAGKEVNAIEFAGGFHFEALHFTGFKSGIKQVNHYSDLLRIERCSFYNMMDGGWSIDLSYSGDGLVISQITSYTDEIDNTNATPRERVLKLRNRNGGQITGLINGDVLIEDSRALVMSGWHMERGLTTLRNVSGSFTDHVYYMRGLAKYKGTPITISQATGQGSQRGVSLKIENVGFSYVHHFPGGTIEDGTSNIAFDGSQHRAIIDFKRLYRWDGSEVGYETDAVHTGVTIGDAIFDKYSHIASIESRLENSKLIMRKKLPAIEVTSGIDVGSSTSSTDRFRTWKGVTGTYYYKAVAYLDTVRKIGYVGTAEWSKALTNGGIGANVVLTAAFWQPMMIRLYRGTASGSYDAYVDVPLQSGGRLVDNGVCVAGYPWISRTAGAIEPLNTNIDAGLLLEPGRFDALSDAYGHAVAYSRNVTTPPTTGSWRRGDEVRLCYPAVNSGKILLGWMRLTDCTSAAPTHVMGTDWSPMYVSTS